MASRSAATKTQIDVVFAFNKRRKREAREFATHPPQQKRNQSTHKIHVSSQYLGEWVLSFKTGHNDEKRAV